MDLSTAALSFLKGLHQHTFVWSGKKIRYLAKHAKWMENPVLLQYGLELGMWRHMHHMLCDVVFVCFPWLLCYLQTG